MRSDSATAALLAVFVLLALPTAATSDAATTTAMMREMRDRVRNAFFHSWDAYLAHSFPADELQPLACKGRTERSRGFMDDILGRFGLTAVDALDTLAVMGEWAEFENGLRLVIENVTFGAPEVVSVFETSIRVLGGLLSAHMLATDNADRLQRPYAGELLQRAVELGTRLLPAFSTPTGIPCARVHLVNGAHCDSQEVTTAEAGTLLLEFGLLSELSGRPEFRNAADTSLLALWSRRTRLDMLGTTINVRTGAWKNYASSIGAGVDSFFEYLFKAYVLFGDRKYLDIWWQAYSSVLRYQRFSGQYYSCHAGTGDPVSDSLQNLAMFWPALQVLTGDVDLALEHYYISAQVVADLGFPPESYFIRKGKIVLSDSGYALRPEFVESTLFLYRATRDPVFLALGKEMVEALEDHCRIACGFAAIGDLSTMKLQDRLDTFFFSETLKYLYLLFDPDNPVLVRPHLFTTQAHVIPLLSPMLRGSVRTRELPAPSFMSQCKNRNGFELAEISNYVDKLRPLVAKYSATTETTENLLLRVQSSRFGTLVVPAASSSIGPPVPTTGLHGSIVFASPANGCKKPDAPFPSGSFGVVQRGGCWFSEKALNMQRAGAIGTIVLDNVTQSLFTMVHTQLPAMPPITIPSVLVGKEHGDRISSWLAFGETLDAVLAPLQPAVPTSKRQ